MVGQIKNEVNIMPYNPTEWNTGDVITADKLNNIEQGIVSAGGGDSDIYYVDATYDDDEGNYYVRQGTYANITNELATGKIPYLCVDNVPVAFYSGKNYDGDYAFSRIFYTASSGKICIETFIVADNSSQIGFVNVEVNH